MTIRNRKKTIPVYLCSIDASYSIPDDYSGVQIFFDEKSVYAHKKCTNSGCGITKLELDVSKPVTIKAENHAEMIRDAIPIDSIPTDSMSIAGNYFKQAWGYFKRGLNHIRFSLRMKVRRLCRRKF